jgi:3-keto-disaccharide hydrolase
MRRQFTVLAIVAALGIGQESRPAAFDASAWRNLFDGSTLDGWVTKGGHYDGNAAWTAEDGAISGREGPDHAGGLLYTARKYACFILSLDVWMTRPNDSGIFVRMAPDARGAQVTLDDRDDGEIGAVYSDEFLAHNAKARGRWKPSTWTRVEVRVTGRDMHVEAWIDGEKVTDHQIPPGTAGFAPTGLIGLQVHGNRNDPPGTVAKFKNVRIRELPVFDTAEFSCDESGVMTPTAEGTRRAWKLLWNGSETREALASAHLVNRGFVVFPEDSFHGRDGGVLSTIDDFENFELIVDFQSLTSGANSGVFLRAKREDSNAAFSGCEIQILDDENWSRVHGGAKLEPWQHCGSIYGSSPPRVQDVLVPVGFWNTYRIVYQGSRLRVDLNGAAVQDADVLALPVPAGEKKFAERAKTGFIGFQRHDQPGAVAFRNVFVRRLP